MIEMMLQGMGITQNDVKDIKKLVDGLNQQPRKIADLSNKLDVVLTKLSDIESRLDKIESL